MSDEAVQAWGGRAEEERKKSGGPGCVYVRWVMRMAPRRVDARAAVHLVAASSFVCVWVCGCVFRRQVLLALFYVQ